MLFKTMFKKNLLKIARKLKVGKVLAKIRFLVLPYLWPFISKIYQFISTRNKYVDPSSSNFNSVILLKSKNRHETLIGPDFTAGAIDWITNTLEMKISAEVFSSSDINPSFKNKILVIDFAWLYSEHMRPFLTFRIISLAYKAKKYGLPIWIFLPDTFSVRFLITTSFLVAFCGGASIVQSNTMEEASTFGIIFPSGPHFWTISKKSSQIFASDVNFENRSKIALLAGSGENRRIILMKALSNELIKTGWDVQFSELDKTWADYTLQVRSAQLNVTTCWMQTVHQRGSKKSKLKIAPTILTHRVVEGFAAGSVVITNRSSVLDFFGFIPGTHYLELWEKDEIASGIELPRNEQLALIASNGNKLFIELLQKNN